MNNNQKGSASAPLIILIVILAVAVIYFAFIKKPAVIERSQQTNMETVQPVTPQSTVSSPTVTPDNSVSMSLPEYVKVPNGYTNDWPPVIKQSSTPYSCATGVSNNGNTTTVQTSINNRMYCVQTTQGGPTGSGSKTHTYKTVALNGNGIQTTTFTLSYDPCGTYEGDTAQFAECQAVETNFDNSLNGIVSSLMSK